MNKDSSTDRLKQRREDWREWLGSHGLPHNEVEGDLILDFVEALIDKTSTNRVIEELEATYKDMGHIAPARRIIKYRLDELKKGLK